jgi:hypothetical protein
MRQFMLVPLLVLLACSGSAARNRNQVHVQVLSIWSQTLRGVGVGSIVGGGFTTEVPCSDSGNADVVQGPISLIPCPVPSSAHQATGSVQNRRVEAILTTEDGKRYHVVLGCQKQYGWCAPMAEHANYVGNLTNQPKWLADYPHRPFNDLIKVSLRPDGKKKATYQIEQVEVLKP